MAKKATVKKGNTTVKTKTAEKKPTKKVQTEKIGGVEVELTPDGIERAISDIVENGKTYQEEQEKRLEEIETRSKEIAEAKAFLDVLQTITEDVGKEILNNPEAAIEKVEKKLEELKEKETTLIKGQSLITNEWNGVIF